MNRPAELPPALVQIVGPTDNWILQKLSAVLVSKLPYAAFAAWRPKTEGKLAYYINYALFNEPSGLIDVGFFTHRDDSHDFLLRAQRMDGCDAQHFSRRLKRHELELAHLQILERCAQFRRDVAVHHVDHRQTELNREGAAEFLRRSAVDFLDQLFARQGVVTVQNKTS